MLRETNKGKMVERNIKQSIKTERYIYQDKRYNIEGRITI